MSELDLALLYSMFMTLLFDYYLGTDIIESKPPVRLPKPSLSFDSLLRDKLHSNLVLRNKHPPAAETPSIMQPLARGVGAQIIKSPLPMLTASVPPPIEVDNPDIVVAGTKQKDAILAAYEAKFKTGSTEVVTKRKGKRSLVTALYSCKRMRPSRDKYYRVDELTIYNVITTVIKEFISSFSERDILNLSAINRDFSTMIPKVVRWLSVDFSSLRAPRIDYESQTEISHHRVDMASAAMVFFGLDPGRFVRWMAGEFMGDGRDVDKILATIKPHIPIDDYNQVKRILTQGCPAQFQFDEKLRNKLMMIKRGNSKNFVENPDLVRKTMNKEERYSHVVALDPAIVLFSPYCRHTMQTLVMKEGKDPRVCWDATTKYGPEDVVINEVTPMDFEALITFGHTKMKFLADIYRARATFPGEPILLAMSDIKACFRFPKPHPDLAGAFGFNAEQYYYLATAMLFGSTASASSWEAFRRAIEALSRVYANRPDLVIKYRALLDMISWDEIDPDVVLTPAVACELNPVLPLTSEGLPTQPARIYVDDALMFGRGRRHAEMTLAAMIEAIFVVMGEPDTSLRQCPLAMDKWRALIVKTIQLVLGLVIDTNRLTVAIPPHYIAEVRELLNSTWHVKRRAFTVNEAQQLTGKLGHLAQGAPWVHHLLTQMYASIAKALATNKAVLSESSREYQDVVQALRTGSFGCSLENQSRHIAFAIKKLARLEHHSTIQHFISKQMRMEIEFLRDKLDPRSDVLWETPIGHIIKRTPTAMSFGDSSLTGMGGYSLGMKFWWHMSVPEEVQRRTLLHKKDNSDGGLISINVLEFVTVIVNYLAALHVVTSTKFTADPHPVLLNVTDNSSALSWTMNACRTSKIGQLLARFFCSLLMNSPLGINSKWISTHENTIADEISRTKDSLDENSQLTFDYSTLQQNFPQLRQCNFFQLKPELVSLIWRIVLQESWPDHNEIKTSLQSGLGKLIGSSGVK